jgi:hypothetical protein
MRSDAVSLRSDAATRPAEQEKNDKRLKKPAKDFL